MTNYSTTPRSVSASPNEYTFGYYLMGSYTASFTLDSLGNTNDAKYENWDFQEFFFQFNTREVVGLVARVKNVDAQASPSEVVGVTWGLGAAPDKSGQLPDHLGEIGFEGFQNWGGKNNATILYSAIPLTAGGWNCLASNQMNDDAYTRIGAVCGGTQTASQIGCPSSYTSPCSSSANQQNALGLVEKGQPFVVTPWMACYTQSSGASYPCQGEIEFYLIGYGELDAPTTPTPTPTPFLPQCPDPAIDPEDAGDLSSDYRVRCGHCIPDVTSDSPFPTVVFGTRTPTPTGTINPTTTASAVPSATRTPTIGAPTLIPTNTASPTSVLSPTPSLSPTASSTPTGTWYDWHYMGDFAYAYYPNEFEETLFYDLTGSLHDTETSTIAGILFEYLPYPYDQGEVEFLVDDQTVTVDYEHRYLVFVGTTAASAYVRSILPPRTRYIRVNDTLFPYALQAGSPFFATFQGCTVASACASNARLWLIIQNPLWTLDHDSNHEPSDCATWNACNPDDEVYEPPTEGQFSCAIPDYDDSDASPIVTVPDDIDLEGTPGECFEFFAGIEETVPVIDFDINLPGVYLCPLYFDTPDLALAGFVIPVEMMLILPLALYLISVLRTW